jgi:hypothetical protein
VGGRNSLDRVMGNLEKSGTGTSVPAPETMRSRNNPAFLRVVAKTSGVSPISHLPNDRICEIAREIKKACRRVSELAPFRGEGGPLVMGVTPRAKE